VGGAAAGNLQGNSPWEAGKDKSTHTLVKLRVCKYNLLN